MSKILTTRTDVTTHHVRNSHVPTDNGTSEPYHEYPRPGASVLVNHALYLAILAMHFSGKPKRSLPADAPLANRKDLKTLTHHYLYSYGVETPWEADVTPSHRAKAVSTIGKILLGDAILPQPKAPKKGK